MLTTDPAHADTFNPLLEKLINNDAYLKDGIDSSDSLKPATGTATNIQLNVPNMVTYSNLRKITFVAALSNVGAATTINVNGLGAKSLYKPNTTTAPNLTAGKAYEVWYSQTNNCFFVKASAEGTAQAQHVLAPYTISNDQDTGILGTMVDRGNVGTVNLTTEGAEYTIAQGYHSGLGKVKAAIAGLIASVIKAGTTVGGILGTFTSDANATASEIANGKTAYVNGSKITGTSTAKKSANGVVDNASGNITFNVSNLGFTPSKVVYLISLPSLNWNNVGVISSSNDLAQKQSSALTNKVEILNSNGTAYYNNFTASVAIQAGGFYVNNVGGGAGYPHKMTWFAYE